MENRTDLAATRLEAAKHSHEPPQKRHAEQHECRVRRYSNQTAVATGNALVAKPSPNRNAQRQPWKTANSVVHCTRQPSGKHHRKPRTPGPISPGGENGSKGHSHPRGKAGSPPDSGGANRLMLK